MYLLHFHIFYEWIVMGLGRLILSSSSSFIQLWYLGTRTTYNDQISVISYSLSYRSTKHLFALCPVETDPFIAQILNKSVVTGNLYYRKTAAHLQYNSPMSLYSTKNAQQALDKDKEASELLKWGTDHSCWTYLTHLMPASTPLSLSMPLC